MTKQNGAALIVVLSLLSISLMVGLSSMQSSQIDERLAGNYRATAQAQMAAETGASASLSDISYEDIGESSEGCLDIASRKASANTWKKSYGESTSAGYYLIGDVVRCDYAGVDRSVLSRGKVSTSSDGFGSLAESFLVFSYPEEVSGAGIGLVLADKDLKLSGNGSVVSVDDELPRIHSNGAIPEVHDVYIDQANVTNSFGDSEVDEIYILDPSGKDGKDDGYVDVIAGYINENASEVWREVVTVTCDPDDAAEAPTRVVFCGGKMDGNLKKNIDNKLVVAVEGIVINPTGQSNIGNVSFVTSGEVDLGGMGSKGFRGVVWAAEKVKIKGNGSGLIAGSVISKGDVHINGAPDFEYDPTVFDDLSIPGVVDNPFSDGSGSGSSTKADLLWLEL